MTFSVGEIVEGVVTKITNYGAFVDLPGKKRGLVRISQIADTYVKDINDFIKERQKIRVKVLTISNDGRKVDLSFSQVDKAGVSSPPERVKPVSVKPLSASMGPVNVAFEEKLSRFLKTSEEKLADLRRNIEAKRGGGRAR